MHVVLFRMPIVAFLKDLFWDLDRMTIFFRNCLGYVWEEQCFTSMVCIWYIMIHVLQTWQRLAKHSKPPSDLYCRDEGAHATIKQGQNVQSALFFCFFFYQIIVYDSSSYHVKFSDTVVGEAASVKQIWPNKTPYTWK